MRRKVAILLIGAAAPLLGGCSVLGYYQQGFAGQLDLMRRSQAIESLLAEDSTDPELRRRLQLVLDIRRFAINKLQLPDNGSYLQYADLERPYVVWNVFAAPEFSLEPVKSCFPVVGCLSYRGYFKEDDAREAAAELAAQGNDVYVGGVAAYSTLGWFADPVLNSMLRWNDVRLARLIFHELAHQKLYAEDDSDFNEAFATAVGEIGVERWLSEQGREEDIRAWQPYRSRQQDFLELVGKTAERLRKLYAIQADVDAMRAAKAEVLADMRLEYRQLRDGRWAGYDGYDHWFQTVNNARIAAVSTYHSLVPRFVERYQQSGGDIRAFYADVAQAATLPAMARRRWLSRP